MKRTNPESRPSFGQHHETTNTNNNNRSNPNNQRTNPQDNPQASLQTFRAATASKRNRIHHQPPSPIEVEEPPLTTPSNSFNPIKTELPTAFVLGLSSTDPQPIQPLLPQINSIFEISKISIRNLKKRPQDTCGAPLDGFYQNSLSNLRNALDDILHVPPKPTETSLTTLSEACQGLVLAGPRWCESLYKQVKDQLENKTLEIRAYLLEGMPTHPVMDALLSSNSVDIIKAIASFDQPPCHAWLEKTHAVWHDWYHQLRLIRSMLVHLDRFILARSHEMLPIWELGLDLFRKNVIGRPWNPISLSLSVVICQQVTLERSGQTIPVGLLQSLTQLVFTAFGTTGFTNLISTSLQKATESFYTQEGMRLIQDVESNVLSVGGPAGYLSHIKNRLESEVELFNKIFTTPDRALNAQLLNSILRLVESNLILVHLETLLTHGLVRLLESFPDPIAATSLLTFYKLLTRLGEPPVRRLRKSFSVWIKATGATMVEKANGGEEEEAKRDAGMVERLIEFKTKLDGIVVGCFAEDREMFFAIKEAFETFINQRCNKPAELIAKYLDLKMRTASRSMNEAEIDTCLEHVLVLFRYSQAKDIFEEFYKRDLAKRLLLSRSSSIDLERNMVMKLKKECGPGFTAKLETMFRDLETSNDLNIAYESVLAREAGGEERMEEEEEEGDRVELTVTVLTSGSWPMSQASEPKALLPTHLQTHLSRFEKFYGSKYLGRRLTWAHSLGQVVLIASFPKNSNNMTNSRTPASFVHAATTRKELTVSTIQALVLLLFNVDTDNLSIDFQSIVQRTGIDEKTAARTLQSLACGKVRVLVKNPKSKEVSKTDRFTFNSNFKDEHFKIKINQIQSKETVEERSSTRDKVVTDRATLIQLSIVRIMKSRKKSKFNPLLFEVIEGLKSRFQVDVKDVKLAIENLISRDYLERLSVDEFHYLA
ncbi:hypothetical protein PGT21_013123 [Puccinia graminis f. sp. tritici]|uniref:Cullin family profile domain-containing protein n=1 Tax=Puccinia graminis f. sp. tritici TaxID=56615 RepID=A0A5B0QT12_PUCGR|nr:hypothetical protein PGT21_013123 [Puccinia graminis f. sp. tritici]